MLLFPFAPPVAAPPSAAPPSAAPTLLAHVMPWYESKPVSGTWGWHWTMNRFDPEKIVAGRREAASHYRPAIGLYDSNDPDAVECQLLLMKLSGIDGVLVDWYGNVDTYDYLTNHRNTQRLFEATRRMGLKFALVYEDQTVPNLIKGGKFREAEATEAGRTLMRWVDRNWFSSPHYVREDGRPLFLVFGPQYYKSEAWTRMFEGLTNPPAFYTLHHRKDPAIGAYDWPLPKGGAAEAKRARERFDAQRKEVPRSIPVAYPRFHDIYTEAGLPYGHDEVADAGGATYRQSLSEALASGARFVQIATWNDWGEGTGIEPTEEFGYRDLETTQRLRKSRFTPADLTLPLRLFKLRKRHAGDPKRRTELAKISAALIAGDAGRARRLLSIVEAR